MRKGGAASLLKRRAQRISPGSYRARHVPEQNAANPQQDTHLPHWPCASFESAGGEAGGEVAGDVVLFRCGSHLHAGGVDPPHHASRQRGPVDGHGAKAQVHTGMAHWHTAQTQIAAPAIPIASWWARSRHLMAPAGGDIVGGSCKPSIMPFSDESTPSRRGAPPPWALVRVRSARIHTPAAAPSRASSSRPRGSLWTSASIALVLGVCSLSAPEQKYNVCTGRLHERVRALISPSDGKSMESMR